MKNFSQKIRKHIKKQKTLVTENALGLFHVGMFIFVYLSNFSYVIWGSFALSFNMDIIHECQFLWIYDLIGVIYGFSYILKGAHTFFITLKNSKSINDMQNINNSSIYDHIFIPLLLIWGLIISSSIKNDCIQIYLDNHRDIWDLFQGTFYGIFSMVVMFSLLYFFEYFNYKIYPFFFKNKKTGENNVSELLITNNSLNLSEIIPEIIYENNQNNENNENFQFDKFIRIV